MGSYRWRDLTMSDGTEKYCGQVRSRCYRERQSCLAFNECWAFSGKFVKNIFFPES